MYAAEARQARGELPGTLEGTPGTRGIDHKVETLLAWPTSHRVHRQLGTEIPPNHGQAVPPPDQMAAQTPRIRPLHSPHPREDKHCRGHSKSNA